MFSKFIPAALFVAAGIIIFSGTSWAHGVSYEMIENSPSITFRSGFSSGDPIAYGEVLIYSPENSEVEYQNGRTDKNGVFSFLPDGPGVWKVEVYGGLGHKLMFEIPIDEKGKEKPELEKKGLLQSSQTMRAALGISILFNIALAALYFSARKKKRIL
ncbi:hypothetical protein [Maridesulfovibrio zosterae]|uniref:hypothetical protein n=1 Tax=Maridesulfovibrio zosterae TaxID=82171 RepID=UPI00041CEEEE|nr:hypothetical protein [Maridesulfovibrio zosterae]